MSSSSKLKRQAKKAEKDKKIAQSAKSNAKQDELNGNGLELNLTEEEKLVQRLERDLDLNAKARAVTGVLGVSSKSRDIKIDNFSIMFHGFEILVDTKLELNCGRRYGLIGQNGCGKSTMLAAIGKREVPIQPSIDIYHLTREMPPSEKTALEAVMEVDAERIHLEKLAEELVSKDDEESQEQLMDIYERLDEIDADKAKAKACYILKGLGFDKAMQDKKCKDFSGGWRMRIALARALFVKPHCLILDEPTNHLDLNAGLC